MRTTKSAASKTSLMPLHNAFSSTSDALSAVNSMPKDNDAVVNIALDDVKRSLRAAATNLRFVMNREDEKRSKRANYPGKSIKISRTKSDTIKRSNSRTKLLSNIKAKAKASMKQGTDEEC